MRKVAAVTGRDLRNARPTIDEYNQPAVSFSLNNDGRAKFGRVTSENIGRQLAIILDDQVQSAPVIESAIQAEGADFRDGSRSRKCRTSRSCCGPGRCRRR